MTSTQHQPTEFGSDPWFRGEPVQSMANDPDPLYAAAAAERKSMTKKKQDAAAEHEAGKVSVTIKNEEPGSRIRIVDIAPGGGRAVLDLEGGSSHFVDLEPGQTLKVQAVPPDEEEEEEGDEDEETAEKPEPVTLQPKGIESGEAVGKQEG